VRAGAAACRVKSGGRFSRNAAYDSW
jgi:hypothetical protein